MSITDEKTLEELDGPTPEELEEIERDLQDDFWASEDNRSVDFSDEYDRDSAEA